ncbi:MAG: beta-1,6-N-acetylglucosaminyltransferase [Algicola sp.]|nr:beta-1,6-N-acetylglucosaminyltransferase [Algicola sp.]
MRKLIEVISQYSDVFIHMDKKSESDYSSLTSWLDKNTFCFSVILLSDRCSVYWGDCSQISATLSLLKAAKEEKDYNFFTLLSGDCFPIKPLPEFNKFLSENKGMNFISISDGEKFSNRVELYHYFIQSKYYRSSILVRKLSLIVAKLLALFKIKNKVFDSYSLAKGSQWFTLSNEFVSYVIDTVSRDNLLESLKYTNCIDELFFQTLLINSEFSQKHKNDNLRLIDWAGGNSPVLLNEEYDFSATESFFARKIDVENKLVFNKLKKLVGFNGV